MIVGADRIAANGDVANKIGTYCAGGARASPPASRSTSPRPTSTIDLATPDGDVDPHRGARSRRGDARSAAARIAPAGAAVRNPAFDVTPGAARDRDRDRESASPAARTAARCAPTSAAPLGCAVPGLHIRCDPRVSQTQHSRSDVNTGGGAEGCRTLVVAFPACCANSPTICSPRCCRAGARAAARAPSPCARRARPRCAAAPPGRRAAPASRGSVAASRTKVSHASSSHG